MAWFTKKKPEDIPEKLRNLTEDEILAKLTKSEELETKSSKYDEDLKSKDDQIKAVNSEFEATKARLAALEANVSRASGASEGGTREQSTNNNEPISFMDDENAAFAQRVAPLAALAFQNGAMTAKMAAQQELSRKQAKAGELSDSIIFDKYENEVDKLMEQVTPDRRVYKQSWLQAFAMVKGNHLNDILAAARSGDNTFFAEVGGNNTPPPPEKKDEKLTPEEEHVARRMKITPEQYAKQKKSIQVVP